LTTPIFIGSALARSAAVAPWTAHKASTDIAIILISFFNSSSVAGGAQNCLPGVRDPITRQNIYREADRAETHGNLVLRKRLDAHDGAVVDTMRAAPYRSIPSLYRASTDFR
jgi:hypothetical protein